MGNTVRRTAATCISLAWVLVLLTLSVGCAPLAAPPELAASATATATATTRPTADTAQIWESLRQTASLQEAAEQCAAAIGMSAGAARIRIEVDAGDQCIPCNRVPLEYMDRGQPLSEVKQPLPDTAWVWLTVEELLCVYLYDGETFKPTSVTRW